MDLLQIIKLPLAESSQSNCFTIGDKFAWSSQQLSNNPEV